MIINQYIYNLTHVQSLKHIFESLKTIFNKCLKVLKIDYLVPTKLFILKMHMLKAYGVCIQSKKDCLTKKMSKRWKYSCLLVPQHCGISIV